MNSVYGIKSSIGPPHPDSEQFYGFRLLILIQG